MRATPPVPGGVLHWPGGRENAGAAGGTAAFGGRGGLRPPRGCKAREGCFSKGCEWLGLGNRLWRFPKGFWGMAGYGREIGWGTCRVAGNRSVRGGGGVWRPGGLRPPGQPNQSKGRPALALCALRAPAAPPRDRSDPPQPLGLRGSRRKKGRAHPRIEGWEKGRIA